MVWLVLTAGNLFTALTVSWLWAQLTAGFGYGSFSFTYYDNQERSGFRRRLQIAKIVSIPISHGVHANDQRLKVALRING